MISWNESNFFKKKEFRHDEVDYISSKALKKYNKAREITGVAWYPSLVKGALARFDSESTSRHCAVGRMSDALDFFPEKSINLKWFLFKLVGSGLFGGIGFYFDTKGFKKSSNVMVHVDCRDIVMGFPLVWCRGLEEEGKYDYVIDSKIFDKLLEKFDNVV